MRQLLHIYRDLLGCIAVALAMPLLMELDIPLLRIPFGLAMVLFMPGYSFVAAIFARRAALDGPALVTMSCGLSVTLLPFLGLVLNGLPWGIRPWPIVLALSGWTIGWALLAMARRTILRRTAAAMPVPALQLFSSLRGRRRQIAALLGLLLVAGLLVGTVLIVRQPDPTARLTEFYLLGAAGLAESYPAEARIGQPMQVTVGIVNQELAVQQYRIAVYNAQQRLTELGPVDLASGQRWEAPLSYALSTPGPDQRIELLLYRQNEPQPYRRLTLWVNIRP